MLQRKKPFKGLSFHFMERRLLSGLLDKERASRITGSVIKFDRRKGYGFIKPNDGGPDIFVHYTDICQEPLHRLQELAVNVHAHIGSCTISL
ncbi:hypothetical protein C922_04876 [Plasmodium inui San Antonio 1]|uniref:CSD domain-containing protein n=1 Tax=Plasmodium inui San Antonio 1 TaxID=1237626 RepID=W6ZVA8_9APIC|nr:hypothetical protein C922_04876 [Plasmodium inui San Antonio 1]EUD64732.1 hypothetical protein C922_04876 [Plasmodium inui San Antonio 1]